MRHVPLLDQLDAATRQAILEAGPQIEVPEGSFLVHDGDNESSIFAVLDGLLKVAKTSYAGQVSFLALCREGTLVGEMAMLTGEPRSSSVEAIRPATVVKIGRERFERLVDEYPDLGRALLTEIAVRIRDATMQIHDLTNADATTRIAARLLQLAEEVADVRDATVTLSLPISQEELADWAGLSRAGAVKALRALRNDGLIETSRMSVVITDLPSLRAVAVV